MKNSIKQFSIILFILNVIAYLIGAFLTWDYLFITSINLLSFRLVELFLMAIAFMITKFESR